MPRFSEEYLLDYLRSAEDTQNIAWSVRFIAKHAHMSPTTVRSCLRGLIKSGRLAIARKGVSATKTPNTYRIVHESDRP